MKVYVNNRPLILFPGMTVRHALIKLGLLEEIERGKRVYDEWGNELGLDGEMGEGMRIFIKDRDQE